MNVSKKYIISIDEFAVNYCGINVDAQFRLTHDGLCNYLFENKDINLISRNLNKIKKVELMSGDVVLVNDGNCVCAYDNPCKISNIRKLNSTKKMSNFDLELFNYYIKNDDNYSKKKKHKKILKRRYEKGV